MMKPGKSVDVREEIAEVHTSARSPSPKQRSGKSKSRSRSRSGSRRLSNGHRGSGDVADEPSPVGETPPADRSDKAKARDTWIKSEHESLDTELPIHDQIKQGILGFVENEIKKSDKSDKPPSFYFCSHDPNGLDEKFMRTLSRPSSGHKEKRSPSYRKKKRHSSRHRDRDLHDFEIPGSSLSALERVDDYLKEYNRDEVVTLSGELEIEANDVENNNGSSKELRHKPRKTRRKTREERERPDSNANGRDVSPKVFKTGKKDKTGNKPARPTDLTAMLETLESSMPYHEQYIDNPFSSPSPLTSPNDERLDPFGARRPEKIYLQGGGTFRAVSRDRILESQQSRDNQDKYLNLGELTPVDVAVAVQRGWMVLSNACPGVLGGLALLHLLLVSCSDELDANHLAFHSVVTMPYVATYYFFCVLCLVSVLDRLDVSSLSCFNPAGTTGGGISSQFPALVLTLLYAACLAVCAAARGHDELVAYHYPKYNDSAGRNDTVAGIPSFYPTWSHLSVWRGVLALLSLCYGAVWSPSPSPSPSPADRVLCSLTQLQLQHYQHHQRLRAIP